jgi:hypothetical protein
VSIGLEDLPGDVMQGELVLQDQNELPFSIGMSSAVLSYRGSFTASQECVFWLGLQDGDPKRPFATYDIAG